ncbi:MAG TPA: hypothetical protein VND80_04205 [Steroidobacteraceae bacterium]|nr:hypothetical protein [Steroidobacteraceae bacterium]
MQRKPWIAVAAACLVVLALAGCNREQGDWQKARAANDANAYQLYLQKYPNGSFAAQAQARLSQLQEDQDWQKARAANTAAAYQAFLQLHPEGKWAEEARIRIENFALAQPPGGVPAAPGTAATGPATSPAPPASAAPSGQQLLRPQTPKPRVAARAASGHHGVQLGAFKSGKAAALRHWRVLVTQDRTLLRGLRPRVVAARTAVGRLDRLQVEGLSAARATAICRRLHARSQPCVVLAPPRRARH